MGRRALSLGAVGVVATMMIHSPADSFLGSSVRFPLVLPGKNGSSSSSRSSTACLKCIGGNWSSASRGDSARPRQGMRLRRPARWRLSCSMRGGYEGEGETAGRKGEAEMKSSKNIDAQASALESRNPASSTKSSTSKPQQQRTWDKQERRNNISGMKTASSPQDSLPKAPEDILNEDIPLDNNIGNTKGAHASDGRAGFSVFRCDAFHCEREMVYGGEISSSTPATTQVMMRWNERPRRALVLMKPEQELLPLAAQTINYLQQDMGLEVMVEVSAVEVVSQALDEFTGGQGDARRKLRVFTPPVRSREPTMGLKGEAGPSPPAMEGDGDLIDFVLTLGGDGLLMYSNTLFQRSVPPHLCFNLGSMGFLTPFEYEAMKEEVRRIMNGGMKVSLRNRLSARIIRDDHTSEAFHALNEVVIDRGSSPYLTNLECYCDDQHLTTVQADGLIIATPTGSTAYSMSAGGSMVHPCVPSILFTPICPHSLSFRPIVFPDTVVLMIRMPQEARAEARVSFDGKLSQPLRRGDTLVIKTSRFPVPTICKDDSTADWFASLDQALGFNTRIVQRAFQAPSMDLVRARNDDRFEE